MASWTTPITWTAGSTVTASQMNSEVRDHATWLKNALDVITGSTAADSAGTAHIAITASGTAGTAVRVFVTGDTQPRFQVDAKGKHYWGAGGASALDAFLERTSAAVMTMSGDTTLRNTWASSASNTYFTGRGTADAADRIRLRTDAAGDPRIGFGDGATADLGYIEYEQSAGDLIVDTGGEVQIQTHMRIYPSGTERLLLSETGAQGLIKFNNDATAQFERTATGRLKTPGRFAATDGLATYTKAGTIGDGDFTATAESGLIGLDTTYHRFFVRDGSTWRHMELMGSLVPLGPFVISNPGTATTTQIGIGYLDTYVPSGTATNTAPSGVSRIPMPWGGDVVGMSIRSNATITAGTATFQVVVNGIVGTFSTVMAPGGDDLYAYNTQDTGSDTWTAGQTLGVQVVTNNTAPSTADFTVFLWVLIRRPSTSAP